LAEAVTDCDGERGERVEFMKDPWLRILGVENASGDGVWVGSDDRMLGLVSQMV
jgi:hypothetical protein